MGPCITKKGALGYSGLRLLLRPISNPAVNDWPLAASRTEIEKVRPVFLQVSEEQKAAHHAGLVGVLFSPAVVFAKDRSSRLFFLDCHSGSPHKRTQGRCRAYHSLMIA